MGGLFGGGGSSEKPKVTPAAPRLSDAERTSQEKQRKKKPGNGVQDQILSTGSYSSEVGKKSVLGG